MSLTFVIRSKFVMKAFRIFTKLELKNQAQNVLQHWESKSHLRIVELFCPLNRVCLSYVQTERKRLFKR